MALITEQLSDAQTTGGVTKLASSTPGQSERFQVAGLLGPLLRQIGKQEPSVSKPPSKGPALRVPTETEEALVKPGEYGTRQEAAAQELLSEEGQRRFEEAGGSAKIGTMVPGEEAVDEAVPGAPEPTISEARAEDINVRGAQALRGAEGEKALATEYDALDLLEIYKERGVVIDTDQGIDFNFDRMEDDDDVKAVLNAVSELLESPQDAVKRGIIPNVETLENAQKKLSDELGFSQRILKMKVGDTLNAEDMTALRILLQNSAKKLATIAEKIEAGDNSNATLLAFRKQMASHAALQMKAKGAQTEIARALQAFRIPVGVTDYTAAADELLTETGGPKLAEDLAKGYLKALRTGGSGEANKYAARGWQAKTTGVFHEIYINGLLSWPTTHFKNILGTPLFVAYNGLVDLGTATAMTAVRGGRRAMGMNVSPDGIYFEDVFARYYGMNQAFRDAWIVAGKTFETEIPAGSSKIEGTQLRAIDSETLGASGTWGQAVDYLGRLIRIPGRLLGAQDDFWKTIIARGTLYEEGVRQTRRSKAAGKTDQEALDDGVMIMIDPRAVADEIDATTKYNTLTADLGPAMQYVSKGLNQMPFGKILVPFVKVPTNSIGIVVQNSPLAVFAKGARDDLLGRNGPKAQQRATGRLATGSATMMMFYQYAQEGRFTGAMPKDQSVRNMLPPGWQPYSMVFRDQSGDENPWLDEDGDLKPLYSPTGVPNGPLTYVSYQGLEPVSAFLGIAADTAEKMRRFDDPADRLNFFSAASLATVDYFKNLPFLQGVSEVVRAFEYADPARIISSPMSSMIGPVPVPFSSIARNVDAIQDPTIKRVSPDVEYYTQQDVIKMHKQNVADGVVPKGSMPPLEMVGTVKQSEFFQREFVEGWLLQMRSNPWYEEREQDYEILLDVYGSPIERNVPYSVNPVMAIYNQISPFKIKAGEELNDQQRRLIVLGMPLTNSPTKIKGFTIPRYMRTQVAQEAKQGDVALPVVINGQGKYGTPYKFEQHLEALMADTVYLTSSKDEKIRMIKKAERRFYEAAFLQVLGDPENRPVLEAFNEFSAIQNALRN